MALTLVPTVTRTPLRSDIQALRALAVAGVVVFHLHPAWLSGGYVGVDVFFVISGFLISGHLLREIEATGRISLRRFYGRRARRLLPAAIVVLMFSLAAAIVWLPPSAVRQNLGEIIASTLYVQNWVLANSAVDYLTAEAGLSLVRHFWTLSVEEQFYLLWPLALLALAIFAARARLGPRGVMLAGVAAITVVSLALSVVLTETTPAAAYFVTHTRVWEFGFGAVLAFAWSRGLTLRSVAMRNTAVWIGLAAILGSMVAFGAETPFPGAWALVPVVGTVLVICGNAGSGAWSAHGIGAIRPVQYLGSISYSLYLWHWPLVVLAPVVIGRPPAGLEKLALLAVILITAILSKHLVEDSFLGHSSTRARRRCVLVVIAAGMLLVVGIGAVADGIMRRDVAQSLSEAESSRADPCFGAKAMMHDVCANPTVASIGIDSASAAADYADTTLGDCGVGETIGPIGDSLECSFGDQDAPTTVVVIGDSHGGHWLPTLQGISAERGWRIVSLLRSSCPLTTVTPVHRGVFDDGCEQWKARALDRVRELSPDLVFVGSLVPFGYELLDYSLGDIDAVRGGYELVLGRLAAASGEVVVMKDTPYMPRNVPECLGAHSSAPTKCDAPAGLALGAHQDPLWEAAAVVPGVVGVDLTDLLCSGETCFSVIGNVVVYRDRHHFTAGFASSLGPALLDRLRVSGGAITR